MSRLGRWTAIAIVSLAVAATGLLGLNVPLSYDEAYNLQVPGQLAESGLYATNGSVYNSGPRLFDVRISTGPTLLLPSGGAFALFGEHLFAARAVGLAGYMGLIVAAVAVASRFSGLVGGAIAAAGLIAIDTQIDWPATVIFGPADVLGEQVAAALLLASAAILRSRPMGAGIALGGAVLTKLVAVAALPAFLFALMLSRADRTAMQNAMRFVTGVAAPLIFWNLWQWVSLGPTRFEARTNEFLRFAIAGGSGLDSVPSSNPLNDRLFLLTQLWHTPALPVTVLVLIGASIAVRRIVGPHDSEVDQSRRTMSWAIIGSAMTLAVWWLVVSDRAYGRHLLIAPMLIAPLVAGWLTSTPSTKRAGAALRGTWVGSSILTVSVLAACVIVRMHSLWEPPGTSIEEQRRAAHALTETRATQFTFHGSWWQAPELAFLAGLVAVPHADPSLPMVITPLQRTLDPRTAAEAEERCGQTIYQSDGYRICWQAAR